MSDINKMKNGGQRAGSRFHVMVKPTGPLCNLNCSYCFYLHKQKLLETSNKWRMSDKVLERFIRQYIGGQNYHEIIFSWQGGEPMLLGLEFFEKVVAIEKKYCPPGKLVENDLQTNGVLLDDEWCRFLRKNYFLVGLSIDGPKDLHDKHRLDNAGGGSFDRVFKAAQLLKTHGVQFNTLTTVNRDNAKKPLEVYRFLRDEIRPRAIQFNPCVETKVFEKEGWPFWGSIEYPRLGSPTARPGNEHSVVTDWSVDADDYGDFLCAIFDEWYAKDVGRTFVYNFECAVSQWMGIYGVMCAFGPICGKCLAIEHDGSVYSCDHFVYPKYRLGNIADKHLADMAFSAEQIKFGSRKDTSLPRYCRQCEYLFACHGECPKNRILLTPDAERGLNYLCSGLKKYFGHIKPYVEEMVEQLDRVNRAAAHK
jgi:uncharacterized protein